MYDVGSAPPSLLYCSQQHTFNYLCTFRDVPTAYRILWESGFQIYDFLLYWLNVRLRFIVRLCRHEIVFSQTTNFLLEQSIESICNVTLLHHSISIEYPYSLEIKYEIKKNKNLIYASIFLNREGLKELRFFKLKGPPC